MAVGFLTRARAFFLRASLPSAPGPQISGNLAHFRPHFCRILLFFAATQSHQKCPRICLIFCQNLCHRNTAKGGSCKTNLITPINNGKFILKTVNKCILEHNKVRFASVAKLLNRNRIGLRQKILKYRVLVDRECTGLRRGAAVHSNPKI